MQGDLNINRGLSGRLLFLSVWLVFHTTILFADSFRHLNVENGLSSRRVFQIQQDSMGFMWFFTHAGIDRYDGNEIRHYLLSENLHSEDNLLSSTRMICDKHKNVWTSIKSGKIFYYDKLKDEFKLRIDLNDVLPDSVILNNIMFDNHDRLWLCLASGLYYLEPGNDEVIKSSDFNKEQVTAIIPKDNGSCFVGTYNHVYILETGPNEKLPASFYPVLETSSRVESMLFHQGKLYVGTFSSSAYIVGFPGNEITQLKDMIPGAPIRAITVTGDNRIIFGTDGSGLFCMDAGTGQLIKRYTADEDIRTSPRGNTVCDVFADRNNCIWIGTSTNGISILDPRLPKIDMVRHEHKNLNSLISDHVNVILEDSEGDMWYGTNDGISMFSPRSRKWQHFLTEMDRINPVVLALSEDIDGNIWAGGFGIGAYCIDKRTGRVQQMPSGPGRLTSAYIYSIFADGNYIWLGGIEGELTRYDVREKTYRHFQVECIGDIRSGGGDTLLMATCPGMVIFNKSTGSISLLDHFNGAQLNCPVRCLLRASTGDVWLATDGMGLIRFNPVTGQSSVLPQTGSNSVLSILEDDFQRIWFSTENGLFCIDPRNGMIVNMDEYIGTESRNYNANASIRRRDGQLVFGTADGAVSFLPGFTLDENDLVKLIFTDFGLSYKSMKIGEPGSPLKKAIDETTSISLKYSQNSFSFSFSSINFNQPHKIRYQCKLDGFDDWHNVSGNVGYTNIGPGKYEFLLRAVNKYTGETIDERGIRIVVGRPVWASEWAFMIYFGIIVVISLLVVQYIKAQMEERNSKEKIGFFINVAHDIRTPVSLIKAPLSDLENENLSDHGRRTLSTAIRNTEKLYSLVTQLLDFQKADLSALRLVTSENELYSYMNEKVASFNIPASQKNITLRMEKDFEHLEVYFDRGKMDKIMDNLLSNAVKYTPEGGYITVSLSGNQDKWSAEVSDTGIGIPAGEQKNLFRQFYRAGNAINSKEGGSGIGLLLTRKLVLLHGGEIQFTSTENKGSTFKVSFPTGTPSGKEDLPDDLPADVPDARPKEKILLVEDNDEMRSFLRNSLSQEYQVFDLPDGRMVIDQISGINPDIIISDVLMPFLRGDEMCRMLKSSVETSHIPVILLTALNDRENIIMGLESGADDYITKPFDSSVLKVRIRNILQNREKLRKAVASGSINAEEINYTNELDKAFMDKAIDLINKEMSNPDFSINEFCMSMGMSRSSIYSKIKTLTGQAPNDFIRIIRLNKAKELLKTQKYNISEVSVIVGFSDAKYFSTSFKKQFGISPSKATRDS